MNAESIPVQQSRRLAYVFAEQLLDEKMPPSAVRVRLYEQGFSRETAHSVMADLRERHPAALRRLIDPGIWLGASFLALAACLFTTRFWEWFPLGCVIVAVSGVIALVRGLTVPKQYKPRHDPDWLDERWHISVPRQHRIAEQVLCPVCKSTITLSEEEAAARAYTCSSCGRSVRLTT